MKAIDELQEDLNTVRDKAITVQGIVSYRAILAALDELEALRKFYVVTKNIFMRG